MTSKNHNVLTLKINNDALGLFFGKGRIKYTNILAKYSDVSANILNGEIYTTITLKCNDVDQLQTCYNTLDRQRRWSEQTHEAHVYAIKIEKEKEARRQVILAARRIRDNIEKEMKQESKNVQKSQAEQTTNSSNMFASLPIDE